MASRKSGRRRASITLRPKRPDRSMRRVIKDFKKEIKRMGNRMEKQGLIIIKRETPVRTGRTRDLWVSTLRTSIGSGFTINFNNPSDVVGFLNRGTLPSPKRYIPSIEKRIFGGVHPGIQATKFLDTALVTVKSMASTQLKRLPRSMQKSIKRRFRVSGRVF